MSAHRKTNVVNYISVVFNHRFNTSLDFSYRYVELGMILEEVQVIDVVAEGSVCGANVELEVLVLHWIWFTFTNDNVTWSIIMVNMAQWAQYLSMG